MKNYSIYEVAALAGVSIATVSRTINQPHRVSEATRARVMEVVTRLDYKPDFEAAARARHHKDKIAVLAPFSTRAGFVPRLKGLSSVLDEREAELTIFQIKRTQLQDPDRIKMIDAIASSGRFDGLILISLDIDNQNLSRIAETNFPTALIEIRDPRFFSINVENTRGAEMAVSSLIDKNYQKIGFLGYHPLTDDSIDASSERFLGYVNVLLESKRTLDQEFIVHCEYGTDDSYRVSLEFLSRPVRPDAIFCASDICALGLMKAAWKLGLRIPQDLAVIGFDDIDFAEYFGLTTIRQELEGSGAEAARIVLDLIHDNRSRGLPTDSFLPLMLVERATT